MTKTIRILLLTVVCAVSLSLAPARADGWSVGDRFPELDSFILEGEVPALEGKVVLVDFWASWCTPCKASFPTLDELNESYGDRGLVVLGVNVDTDLKAFERFMQRMDPGFAVVRDGKQELVAAAEVKTMPSSFMIGRDGIIRSVHSGYHGSKTREAYIEEIEVLLVEEGEAEE